MTSVFARAAARRVLLGSTSIAAMLLATGGVAVAQEQGSVETVMVTGFRASLENTIALKKESTQIIEAVSAEDIGKLPDQSIGEAISRLPGIATQRLNGRAQDIAIRGLSADFATTLLNGREQVSTNDNRSVQFDQYPAELMSGVVIYKTPAADLVGAGLSGTIDMRTIRPLDYDHMVFSTNVRGETNSLGELNPKEGKYGWRLSGTFIDQFDGGKLGLMVGVALMDSLNPYQEFAPWGWPNGNGGASVPSSDYVIGGAKFNSVVDDLKRQAAIATLQFRPNENFESTLDLFFTRYKDNWQVTRIEAPQYSWGGQDLLPGYTVTNGYVTAGTFTPGVKQVGREEADHHNNDLFAIGWKNTYNKGPWTAMLDAGYSSVQRSERLLEEYAGTGPWGTGATDPMPFTMDGNDVMHVTPAIDYGSYNNMQLTSPQPWSGAVLNVPIGQEGYVKYDYVHDHMATLKAEAQYEAGGFFKNLTFGLYYTNRTKVKWTNEYMLTTKTQADAVATYMAAHGGSNAGYVQTGTLVPDQYRTGISKGLSYFGFPAFAGWDPDELLDNGFYYLTHNTGVWAYQKGYQVNEIVYTGYVKADIDSLLGSHALTGNVGVQFVLTHQSSSGYAVTGSSAYPIHGGAEYGEVLPSLNLALEITDSSKIRLGAARELVRARMDQMVDVNSYGYNKANFAQTDINLSPWSGQTGNPKLKPWIADAVDLSYEYYHGRGTYLAVAGFYKNLETYIFKQSTVFDFTGYAYDTTAPAPAMWKGYVTEDVNGSGGEIVGVELSGAVAGDAISDWFDGFGLTGNVSYTDSSIKGVTNTGPSTPLPGLSKLVYNGTLFYENSGFSARVNYNYRSRFYSEIKGFDNTYTRNEFKAQAWLGAQIGYTFGEGALNGFAVNFQADNLLHSKQTMYQFVSNPNDTRQVLDWWRFGTTYQVSLSYRLN